jgi:hypothetical protein
VATTAIATKVSAILRGLRAGVREWLVLRGFTRAAW